jgi:large subunit ribosomal protein L4
VTDKENEALKRATKNLKNVMVITANKINTYDLVNHQKMLITKEALKIIEEVFV